MRATVSVALFVFLNLSGCATHPFLNREVPVTRWNTTAIEGETEYFLFAYGKFCGPGYPPDAANEARKEQLFRLGPPMDDLDAICYAHDYCYAETDRNNDALCDLALRDTIIDHKNHYEPEHFRCWGVATDIMTVFFGKFWQAGADFGETWGVRTSQALIGSVSAAFYGAVKLVLRPFRRFPDEGNCNVNGYADAAAVIDVFEANYADSPVNRDGRTIDIPLVDSATPGNVIHAEDGK